MASSVRTRLTLWYTGAMSFVLIALAITTYLVLSENIVRRADANAMELANSFLATFNAELNDPSEPDRVDESLTAAMAEHRFRDVLFVVFGPEKKLAGISEGDRQPRHGPVPTREEFEAALQPLVSSNRAFQDVRVGGRGFRSYLRVFTAAGKPETLFVLQSLHPQNEFLRTLAGTFGIVIPLTILAAGVGGYFLARRSLSPVVVMSAQASRIGGENLHERLQVQNPADELGQLAASFNGLLDRLDQSFERQRRFVADASHELRTPVAILYGEAEVTLSQTQRTEGEYRESLQILREEAKRLKHIVEDLFTLARADAGQHPLALRDFYLDELAAECSRNVRTLASAKQITLHCESGSEMPIHADEALVRRMLLNLLDNAIKYTPTGGNIALRCEEENGDYRLSLEDSGQGIPTEFQAKVFERFFRVDKARSRDLSDGGGAGLGLAIASWIAQAHGGSLTLTHSSATGSTFTATLPKASS